MTFNPVTAKHEATLARWVAVYRERLVGPLPGRMDRKRPLPITGIEHVLRSWHRQGLIELKGSPRASGWMPCKAIGREDEHPSAAIHVETGAYVDSGTGTKLDLLNLGVELGVYRDRAEAYRELSKS